MSDYQNIRVNGINAINIDEGDELLDVIRTDGKQQIFIATHDGMAVRFNETDVRPMGRVGPRRPRRQSAKRRLCRFGLCGFAGRELKRSCRFPKRALASRRTVNSYRLTKRGGIGVINMKTTDKTGKVVAAFPVEEDSEIMIITQQAKLIRLGVDKIRETGR